MQRTIRGATSGGFPIRRPDAVDRSRVISRRFAKSTLPASGLRGMANQQRGRAPPEGVVFIIAFPIARA